jgi:hypothetical protein
VFSAPQRRRCLSLSPPLLRFSGTTKYARGNGSSGPGWPHHRPTRPGVGPCPLVVSPPYCSSRLLLLATFIFWYYTKIWAFLWNCWSSKIWCLDGPFYSRILTPATSPPIIIKHVKIEETT